MLGHTCIEPKVHVARVMHVTCNNVHDADVSRRLLFDFKTPLFETPPFSRHPTLSRATWIILIIIVIIFFVIIFVIAIIMIAGCM